MHLLHIYDHSYYAHGGKWYSNGAFTQSSWNRYLEHFDTLTILGNQGEMTGKSVAKMNRVDREKVSFEFVENYRRLKPYAMSFLKLPERLSALIDAHDAVVIRVPGELAYIAAAHCQKTKKPYALEVVGCPWDAYWNYGSLAGKLMAPHSWWRMKKTVKAAPFVIYVTEFFLQERYPTLGQSAHASNVMLPTMDAGNTILIQKKQRIKETGRPLRLGMIAGLDVRYKGFQEAIRALGKVKDRIPPFELHLVGSGEGTWLSPIAKKANLTEQINIVGRLSSGKDIFDFLDGLDVYLHPSKQEGLPRALIEAMSRACPALASSAAGIPELLPQEYLHPPGDFSTLARQLLDVLNCREQMCEMATTNFARAKAYSTQALAKQRHSFWGDFRASLSSIQKV